MPVLQKSTMLGQIPSGTSGGGYISGFTYTTLVNMNAVTGTAGQIVSCAATGWQYIWRTDLSSLDTPQANGWYYNGPVIVFATRAALDQAFLSGWFTNIAYGTYASIADQGSNGANQGAPLIFGSVLINGVIGPYPSFYSFSGYYIPNGFDPLQYAALTGSCTVNQTVITGINTTNFPTQAPFGFIRSTVFGFTAPNQALQCIVESVDVVGVSGQITVSRPALSTNPTATIYYNGIDVSLFNRLSSYITVADTSFGFSKNYLYLDQAATQSNGLCWQLQDSQAPPQSSASDVMALDATNFTDGVSVEVSSAPASGVTTPLFYGLTSSTDQPVDGVRVLDASDGRRWVAKIFVGSFPYSYSGPVTGEVQIDYTVDERALVKLTSGTFGGVAASNNFITGDLPQYLTPANTDNLPVGIEGALGSGVTGIAQPNPGTPGNLLFGDVNSTGQSAPFTLATSARVQEGQVIYSLI